MFVFSNLATSLDGKIATASRAFFHLGTPADRRQMQVLRKRADVVVMGASTLRTCRFYCGLKAGKKQPANAILSTRLEGISPGWAFFKKPGVQRILFVTAKPSAQKIRAFEQSSEIIQLDPASRKKPISRQILDELQLRGLTQVLVEGGGSLMWDFISAHLLDEINLTLTPKVVGGTESPTLVDGKGFSPAEIPSLKLMKCRKLGNELYLTYRFQNRN